MRASPLSCFSGSACWATGNGSIGYSASEDSVLGARLPFDFSAFAGPAFFSAQISVDTLAGRDGLFLEWSSDGGSVWRSTGGFQYDSSALVGSRLERAFGGLNRDWRLVSGTIDGVQGLASVLFRFRFRASGASGARGGVLVDDIIVSKSALPACPTVTAPDNGQTVNPVPFVIQWSPSGAAYYDLELRQGGNVTVVGVGVGSQWQSPAMPVGLYEYSIRAREPDNTTNPFCQRRSINVAFVDYVRVFPFEAGFEGSESGFRNVDYDSGRFIAGPVPANKQFAASPSGAAAYTSGTLQAVSWFVYETPFFNFTLLPAAILSFDYTHRLGAGSGAQVQFSLNRGTSWHAIGVVGAGQNWYNGNGLSAFNFFIGPGAHPGFTGVLNTWRRATFSINSGSMPFDSWYSCSPEVAFRVVVAIGSDTASGQATGFAFDNFRIAPDQSSTAACAAVIPSYTPPPPLTPVPTPVAPVTNAPTPLATTTTASTTIVTAATTTTTTALTTSPQSTTTAGETSSGETARTTRPGTGVTTAGTNVATTTNDEVEVTVSRVLPTFAPTPARPPTEGEVSTTSTSGTNDTLIVNPRGGGGDFPGWAIAVIVVGLCCFLLFFLLLAALLRNRYNKNQAAKKAIDPDDEQLRRGAPA